MQKLTCDQTRRALDELMLSDEISKITAEHLNDCPACRDFHTTQTKLRQMVGSLGTVPAPPDFDFKLRARLASEPATSGFNFWPVAKWSMTGVAAVVLFVGGFSVVRQVTKQTPGDQVVISNVGSVPTPAPDYKPAPVPQSSGSDNGSVATLSSSSAPPKGIKVPSVRKEKRPQVAVDFSSEQAGVTNATQPGREDIIFRVDATGQPITVSLDDGRGNARTISVPTVTFGSQRVIGSNQYAPKGVW
jgi:hypothetical protein